MPSTDTETTPTPDDVLLHRMRQAGTRDQRNELWDEICRQPLTCPAVTRDWVITGQITTCDEFDNPVRSPIPPLDSGTGCRTEASTHKHGCCWCGKFKTSHTTSQGQP